VPIGAAPASMAISATGGSLLARVRRLLYLPEPHEGRHPRMIVVVAATLLLVGALGVRVLVVAQSVDDVQAAVEQADRGLGPVEINEILGYDLFPGPITYATDDPAGARAWDVAIAYPDGEMKFLGFTGRSLIRFAYQLEGTPIADGPAWFDNESITLRPETTALNPDEQDYRAAIRAALEQQLGVRVERSVRTFPVFGLQLADPNELGANLRPSTSDCYDAEQLRRTIEQRRLLPRGQQTLLCGMDHTIRGPVGYRVTIEEFARSLRGFQMEEGRVRVAREVVDQTGLTGVYDLELRLGFLPFAAIATAHPDLGKGLGVMGVRTFPQAIEEQLGLTLVPTEVSRNVAVIAAAGRRR
jgi:uncharacterized protein (TIGR03435 family)